MSDRNFSASSLEDRTYQFCARHSLFSQRSTVVVAVSGGPDSLCLLNVLNRIAGRFIFRLHVAHLDHGLRGAGSKADARFVKKIAASMKLPATFGKANAEAYRLRHHLSPEEASRELRYRFLSRIAEKTGASAVAVGHTRDDHIETILLHLIRGTALAGLQGLKPATDLRTRASGKPVHVVRPLLDVSRSETEAYCEELGVKPRLDPSNADSRFLRNFVRLQLLPLLRKANTDFDTAIVRLASSAGEAYGLIHAHAEKAWPSIVETGQAFLRLDKHLMLGQPAAIRDELVRMAIIQLLGETRDFESKHISAISSMTASPAGIRIDLPHGLKASTEYASVRLSKVNLNKDTHPAITGVRKLKIPGTTSFQGWIVTSEKSDKPFPLPTDPFTGVFDFDFIEPPLSVSARRPGDRFQPLGMSEQMKLQDFMVNCHIPVESRDSVPLVRTSSGIVWVVGHRISHLARITPETRKFLRLRFEPK